MEENKNQNPNKEKNEFTKKNGKIKQISNQSTNQKNVNKKNIGTLKKVIITILIVVIISAIISLIYFLCFASKIVDLNSYVSLSYEGISGHATATISVNEDGLKKCLKDEELSKKFTKKIEENSTISKENEISNGDEIEIKVNIKSSWLKENKIKLKDPTIKIAAEGIEEAGTIDMPKCVDITCNGFNGYATAEVKINTDKLSKVVSDESLVSKIVNETTFKVTNNGKLSNGDTIKVTINLDKDWLEENGYQLKSSSFQATDKVNNLAAAAVLDAFADVTFSISGTSPNLKITVTNNSTNEFLKNIKYTLSKSTGISNGEKITVTANYNKEDAKSKGFIIKEETYQYTVKAETSYPMSVSELNQTTVDAIKKTYFSKAKAKANESKSIVHNNFTEYKVAGENAGYSNGVFWNDDTRWELDITVGDPVLSAMYLLTEKDTSNSFNYVYAIYRVPFTSTLTGTSYDWYITVEAKNVSIKSDGSLTENASYEVYIDNGSSQESAYAAYINSKKDACTVESISY